MKNFYDILGLEVNADSRSIKSAYRKLSLKFHPDKNPNDKYFEKIFKDINEANEVLSNIKSKSKYDDILKIHLNNGNDINAQYEDIEKKIKDDFEDLLRQRESEIKKKYWSKEQFEEEELRKRKENEKLKLKEIKERISREIKQLKSQKEILFLKRDELQRELLQNDKAIESIKSKIKILEVKIYEDQLGTTKLENGMYRKRIQTKKGVVEIICLLQNRYYSGDRVYIR